MDRILIITNADMSLQSGDIVLVNRRAKEIFKQFNIKTTCIVFKKKLSSSHRVKEIDYIIAKNKNEIKEYILINKPKQIIFYGERCYLYLPYFKRIIKNYNYDTKILLDIQGAIEESIEYSGGISLFKNYYKYFLKKILTLGAINMADGALVVSDEMKEYCYSYLKIKNRDKFRVFKIRCGINNVISTGQKRKWRKEIRELWKIDENTIVMVFSGYRDPWQNIDKIVELFKEYDKKMENVFFVFLCNIDNEFKKQIRNSFYKGNYELNFLSFSEYFKYLCACDVGYIVRDYNVTNTVAFPNKFSDYMNSGLIVAMNKALPEPIRILENNNVMYVNIDDKFEINITKIKKRQDNILEFYQRLEEICRTELLYSNQVVKLRHGNFL